MSNEEKKAKFKEELRKIVSETVGKELDKRTQTQKPSAGHETVEDLMKCKDCGAKAEAIVIEKLKDAKYECSDCGFPIRDAQAIDECPRCGSKDGREREG